MASSIRGLNGATEMQVAGNVDVYPCMNSDCNVILILHESDREDPFRADSCQQKHIALTLCCARHKPTHQCIECRLAEEAEIVELEKLILKKKQKLNERVYH